MFTTVLFDLDGTLLDLDMDKFLPIYFNALTPRFNHLIKPEEIISQLLASTEVMIMNKDPKLTNQDAFMQEFLARIKIPLTDFSAILGDFYSNDFGKLGYNARQKPLAREVLKCAFSKGLKVVIATNPVFPSEAILHRLKWANIADFPYELVTTYENMHFCKPHLEYYEEILARLGQKPEECLMIGNDVQEDLPARALGIKTFLVKDHLINRGDKFYQSDYEGYFDDLYRCVQKW